MKLLNRDEAIKIAGLTKVEEVEAENCDFTNRVMEPHESDLVEFSACVTFMDEDENERILKAYYYQDQEKLDEVEDLGALDWEIEGYEID